MSRPTMDARSSSGDAPGRGRAAAVLAGAAVLVALLVIGLEVAVSGLLADSPRTSTGSGWDGSDSAAGGNDGGGASGRGELELITRPMLVLPAQASLPHALADTGAGPTVTLPAPGAVTGRLVPGGFPATPEGGVAQLVALTRAGVTGGDLGVYAAAHAAVSEPGAPAAASSYVHGQLVDLRSSGGLRPAGPVPGLTITWTPTSALVKGTASGGSLVVVCVLGQLDVDYQGRVASAGLGDCQALRRVGGAGGDWRIASGPAAAPAPSPWPGSGEAVAAGYRELR